MKVKEYHTTWVMLEERKWAGLRKIYHFLTKDGELWELATVNGYEAPTHEMLKAVIDYEANNYSNV